MLDATIYAQSINLDIENIQAARRNGEEQQVQRSLTHFIHTVNYCSDHGLSLDTNYLQGGFTLRRNGYSTKSLSILIDGFDGWAHREFPNRRWQRYINDNRQYVPWFETDQYWEERRAIERDYVELPPW